jgi:hypothetical protein
MCDLRWNHKCVILCSQILQQFVSLKSEIKSKYINEIDENLKKLKLDDLRLISVSFSGINLIEIENTKNSNLKFQCIQCDDNYWIDNDSNYNDDKLNGDCLDDKLINSDDNSKDNDESDDNDNIRRKIQSEINKGNYFHIHMCIYVCTYICI